MINQERWQELQERLRQKFSDFHLEIKDFKEQPSIEKLQSNQNDFIKKLDNLNFIFQNYDKESKLLMDNFDFQNKNHVTLFSF